MFLFLVFFQAAFHPPIAFTLPHQQLGTVEPVSAQLPIRFKSKTLEIDDKSFGIMKIDIDITLEFYCEFIFQGVCN